MGVKFIRHGEYLYPAQVTTEKYYSTGNANYMVVCESSSYMICVLSTANTTMMLSLNNAWLIPKTDLVNEGDKIKKDQSIIVNPAPVNITPPPAPISAPPKITTHSPPRNNVFLIRERDDDGLFENIGEAIDDGIDAVGDFLGL